MNGALQKYVSANVSIIGAINLTNIIYIPVTPAGTELFDLQAKTEQGAWDKLMRAASHMPYKTKENFIKRGYTVDKFEEVNQSNKG